MMHSVKTAFVNTVSGYGSTGRLIDQLSRMDGIQGKIYYGRKKNLSDMDSYRMTDFFGNVNQALQTFLFDKHAFCNRKETERMIEDLKQFAPDLIHLHNLHGYYLDAEVLFEYLQSVDTPVIWTLHDCWSFTGHCSHYETIGCDQWKTLCHDCPQLDQYPITFNGKHVAENYERKKKLFTSLGDRLHIAVPSQWLADQVRESFLGNTDCTVVANGISLDTFQPRPSEFKKKHHIENRFLVTACASIWTKKKGLDQLVELAKMMPERSVLCVIGVTKSQIRMFQKTAICIERTDNAMQLAEIYTASDVFVNPTLEETFSLVNVESQACGCPVITYRSGGSVEMITGKTGVIVNKNDLAGMRDTIERMASGELVFSAEDCIENASHYALANMYDGYLKLYHRVLGDAG